MEKQIIPLLQKILKTSDKNLNYTRKKKKRGFIYTSEYNKPVALAEKKVM